MGLGGLLGLELLDGVECLVESESGWREHKKKRHVKRDGWRERDALPPAVSCDLMEAEELQIVVLALCR